MSIEANIRRINATIPENVSYIVVSKYRSIDELRQVYDAGMRVFAESRPAELDMKARVLPSDIEWHFIGHLQTNKLKLVLPHCSLVQSVDSIHLMEAMEKWCEAAGKTTGVLVEVHIGAEESKQGFTAQQTLEFFESGEYRRFPHLDFRGLMGMASHTDDEQRIEKDFALIKSIFDAIATGKEKPAHFQELSIGMSQDYHLALRHGATMVRIGSATFE